MDTKFSSAIHALILISESETPMNSEQIATRLRKAEIIEGRRGISGFRLVRKPDDISFLDIYKSVMETDSLHLFDIHQNPNDACIVGHNIRPVLNGMFRNMEECAEKELAGITLADCISNMRVYVDEQNEKEETK